MMSGGHRQYQFDWLVVIKVFALYTYKSYHEVKSNYTDKTFSFSFLQRQKMIMSSVKFCILTWALMEIRSVLVPVSAS